MTFEDIQIGLLFGIAIGIGISLSVFILGLFQDMMIWMKEKMHKDYKRSEENDMLKRY